LRPWASPRSSARCVVSKSRDSAGSPFGCSKSRQRAGKGFPGPGWCPFAAVTRPSVVIIVRWRVWPSSAVASEQMTWCCIQTIVHLIADGDGRYRACRQWARPSRRPAYHLSSAAIVFDLITGCCIQARHTLGDDTDHLVVHTNYSTDCIVIYGRCRACLRWARPSRRPACRLSSVAIASERMT
jgi:hypothetical protein